jgi:probable HAF family extracellular repeat protein
MRISPLRFCVGLLLAGALLAPLPATAQKTILTPLPIITELRAPGEGANTVYALNDRGQAVGASLSANGERAVLWEGGKVVELPTLGGDSRALDINNHGQIVGWSRAEGGEAHPVLWENGEIQDLGLFKVGEDAFANKINEAGQISGGSLAPPSVLPGWFPFSNTCWFWDKGVMTKVDSLGHRGCRVLDINDKGQVLGVSDAAGTSGERSFVWENGVTTDLGSLGGAVTYASDINNRGQVAGAGPTASTLWRAFLWEEGTMTELEAPAGMPTTAVSINDAGEITGGGAIPNLGWRAALWQGGKMVDIGKTLGPNRASNGGAINDSGQLVVFSQSPAPADAFDWTAQGFYWDRGEWSSLGAIQQPVAINARGQVAGNGDPGVGAGNPHTHAWLWQPGLAGLTLWNRLDSQVAVEHSAFGPGGIFGGGSFVPGPSGDVYSASHDESGLVTFPKGVINGPRGAIHFDAKMTGLPAAIGIGPSPSLIGIGDSAGSYYGLEFNARDAQGNGGLRAAAGQFFTAGTGTGEGRLHSSASSSWAYADALAGADPAQWHHYALVWDEDGIVGLGNGTIKVAALVDDKLITKRMQYNPPFEMAAPVEGQLALLNASSPVWEGSVQFSNLNVWSYARLDAAELPPPQLYLPKVARGQ